MPPRSGSTRRTVKRDLRSQRGANRPAAGVTSVLADNLFEPAEFTVDAGAELTFSITNDGAAIHNMRVAGEDNEFNTNDDAVSEEELITAGGAATLQWTAPGEPGVYDFQCDFHTPDMAGTITVE